jgi:D-alanyl-D-alanine carboxypeptidase (penicillin-binding protein 5/6)
MNFMRRHACALLVLLLAPILSAAEARNKPTRPGENQAAYKGAIVTDAATGQVLYEDRAGTVTPPASMTKLMTFAIVHDRIAAGALALNTPVKVTVPDSKIGGTQVYLDPRETFSVEELIYAMMIQSANDAAHALARTAAGSVDAFVALMNAKAQQLGMKQTTFRTPHGLPPATRKVADGDTTTPRDFALLCRHLVQHTDVLKYTSVAKRDFGPQRPKGPQHMENHNKLLGKVAGVDGLKTGFTDAAGYCLSATAQRDGRRVIVVIMGSLGANGQRDYGRARDLRAMELLERGFAALPPVPARAAIATAAPPPEAAAPRTAAPSGSTPPVVAEPLLKPAPRPTVAPTEEQPLKITLPKR